MVSTAQRKRGRRRPAASGARRHARRRRFMVRRLSFVSALLCVVALISQGMPLLGISYSHRGYARAVLPVEAGDLPALPHPQPPDMRRVWDAAIARDPSPELAIRGKTGTSGGRIALTFDDGPDRQTTPLILDSLRKHNLKATFFVVGRQVKKNPGLLRSIVEEGHTIGNHTYDHADLSDLSPKRMRRELQSTQKAVDDALGYHYPMALMRPPYGNPYIGGSDALPAFRRVVRGQKPFPIMWTLDPSDYLFGGHPEDVVRGVVSADKAGRRAERDQVLLLHDTRRQTAQALPRIIHHYERSGRRFADVGELLADKYVKP
jgi:peptidoglycan-N-acetylglucosamine deacetylase